MQHRAGIPASWILLDSQSTFDIFFNARMRTNICDAKRHMILYGNAGTAYVTKKGDLKGYGTNWYHPDGIANILSLNNLNKKYRLTLTVNLKMDLYYTRRMGINMYSKLPGILLIPNKWLWTSLVTTVDRLRNKYSFRQYSSAQKARFLQRTIGWPSIEDLTK